MKYFKQILSIIVVFYVLTIGSVMADEVRLKNGDHLTGQVIRMEEGKLILKTSYAGEISILWQEAASIEAEASVEVVFADKTSLKGIPLSAEKGKMRLKLSKIVETVSFDLKEVQSINPKPPESPLKLKGHINVGLNATRGNTDTKNQHLDGEFVARTKKNRYTLGAEFNRAEDEGKETVNNALGYIKYDHFLSEKWFLYSNALFEKDQFKDLNLRTALGVGAGYQFLETPLTNLSLVAGLTYVNEDFDLAADEAYPAGRWSLNFERYLLDKAVQVFHFHEGFVSLEDTDDVFIRSRTGVRVPIYKNLKATAQYNYDWDKSPEPGRERADETYLLTLGYHW